MTGKELYKLIAGHYADFKKMADEGAEFMKYIYDYKDVDDYIFNGFFDKNYLANEKKMMTHGEKLYKEYIKTIDTKFKKMRSMYAHGFIGAKWNAESIMAKLNAAIKNKDAKEFCEVMAAREDVMDKYFAVIARVDNWIRLNRE